MKNNKLVKLISSFIIGVMFILAVMSVLIVTGVISFGKDEITLKTGSKDSLYNGSPLTTHEFQMVGELKQGHRIEYEFISSQTVVGESPNELQYKILDELDADVTADYSIKHEYGTLKVNPRIVLVICKDTQGRIPQADEYTVDNESYDGLVFDHKLVFREVVEEDTSESESASGDETTESQRSSSGQKKWKPFVFDRNNNDVTANYHIIVNLNTSGDFSDGDATIQYDGDELAEKMFDGDANMIPPVGNENAVLFSVKADNRNKAYLKMESYGDYDGQGWDSALRYDYLIDDQFAASYLTSTALKNSAAKSYNMSVISQCGKYALPYYLSTTGKNEPQLSDIDNTGNTDSEYQASYYLYSTSAKLPSSVENYEKAYSGFVREQYLAIDGETLEYMMDIIKQQSFDASDPTIISKVAQYIQGAAEYNLKYDRKLDKESNVAIAFLDDYKEGVCSHYATAATLLYRALGIPARYTVGVVAYPNGSSYVDVPAKNAHAWVEVYVDGLGWIYVEVTGVIAGANVEVGQSPSGLTECEMYGHDLRPVDAKEPTCTEIGWNDHLACARKDCDYKEKYEEIPELGHKKIFVKEISPTCLDVGYEAHFKCSRCDCLWEKDGKTPIDKIKEIAPLGHKMELVERLEPTCFEPGIDSYYKCSRCGKMWANDKETPLDTIPVLPPLDHLAGEPDPEDHCNVKCQYCETVLEEARHPSYFYDTEDGNKKKCVNCRDEIIGKVSDGEPDPYRVIYTVITSTNKPVYLRETSKNYIGNGKVWYSDR